MTVPIKWVNKLEKKVYYPPKPFNMKNVDSMTIGKEWVVYDMKKIIEPFSKN